jgi:mannose-6-phosphate isomerase
MRVQARQTFVYAYAATLGFGGALEAAQNGYNFIVRNGWCPDGGFARRLGREGGILDATVDLYENAFVLLALAWYARASGESEPVDWAHRTLDWIENNMRIERGLGFENTMPVESAMRQQNPHMHLLEAVLALYETTRELRFKRSGELLLDLFRTHLFDPLTCTLGESFDANWNRTTSPEGQRIEPGHCYEWVWLLSECDQVFGSDMKTERQALYSFAQRVGQTHDHFVVDAVSATGALLDASTRVWPQTEAIKAHLAMSTTVPEAERRAKACVTNLFSRFLKRDPAGTWDEHFAPDLSLKSDKIPATTLYHLVTASRELERALDRSPMAASVTTEPEVACQA